MRDRAARRGFRHGKHGVFMTAKEILKLLRKDGWAVQEQSNLHMHLKHPKKKGRVTVPDMNGDLKSSTVHSIFKQAGGIGIFS